MGLRPAKVHEKQGGADVPFFGISAAADFDRRIRADRTWCGRFARCRAPAPTVPTLQRGPFPILPASDILLTFDSGGGNSDAPTTIRD